MGCRREADQQDDRISLADLVRWMNEQRRPPGAKRVVWRHRNARQLFEEVLELQLFQPHGPKGKTYLSFQELLAAAPLLARAYRQSPPQGS